MHDMYVHTKLFSGIYWKQNPLVIPNTHVIHAESASNRQQKKKPVCSTPKGMFTELFGRVSEVDSKCYSKYACLPCRSASNTLPSVNIP